MPLAPADFHEEIAGGPLGGAAYWATTADGVRIRVGYWPCNGARGTVLLFPGRTEYIEKYGETAKALADRGLATLAIDWRGQGLADRLTKDARIGHVHHFDDYQKDVEALVRAAAELQAPEPRFLLAHSMGGCIGLRAVMNGLPVRACAFTGPMWGINMGGAQRPFAVALSHLGPMLGRGLSLPPQARLDAYVEWQPFEGNTLTTDTGMYEMMRDQLRRQPALSLGGPSLIWLREALRETRKLAALPSPDLPCVTFLGTDEAIVDAPRIQQRMARWDSGTLDMVEGAQHEVLMEAPEIRTRAFDRIAELFDR